MAIMTAGQINTYEAIKALQAGALDKANEYAQAALALEADEIDMRSRAVAAAILMVETEEDAEVLKGMAVYNDMTILVTEYKDRIDRGRKILMDANIRIAEPEEDIVQTNDMAASDAQTADDVEIREGCELVELYLRKQQEKHQQLIDELEAIDTEINGVVEALKMRMTGKQKAVVKEMAYQVIDRHDSPMVRLAIAKILPYINEQKSDRESFAWNYSMRYHRIQPDDMKINTAVNSVVEVALAGKREEAICLMRELEEKSRGDNPLLRNDNRVSKLALDELKYLWLGGVDNPSPRWNAILSFLATEDYREYGEQLVG